MSYWSTHDGQKYNMKESGILEISIRKSQGTARLIIKTNK